MMQSTDARNIDYLALTGRSGFVSAGCRANLFQDSNALCHYDNTRNTNKECFSDVFRSRR